MKLVKVSLYLQSKYITYIYVVLYGFQKMNAKKVNTSDKVEKQILALAPTIIPSLYVLFKLESGSTRLNVLED